LLCTFYCVSKRSAPIPLAPSLEGRVGVKGARVTKTLYHLKSEHCGASLSGREEWRKTLTVQS